MGQGIAQASAMAGFNVQLFDVDAAAVDRAIKKIDSNVSQSVSKNKISESEKHLVLGRITGISLLTDIRGELIIEAVVEILKVKQELVSAIEKISQHSILATNTSTFPVAQVGANLLDPSRCVGLHFFNPAHVMKLVEVIASPATSKEILETTVDFVKSLQKVPVIANDSPGFIVNRVARSYYLESLKLVEDKIASKETIDALLRATGFRMGAFELMDLIGIDTNLAVTQSLYDAFGKPEKFRPNQIQVQMVKEQRLGVKTGKGFYDYPR